MAKYYVIGKVSKELLHRMQKDPSADRFASTKKVVEAVGGKMISYEWVRGCLLYTSPSPRDMSASRMPSSA